MSLRQPRTDSRFTARQLIGAAIAAGVLSHSAMTLASEHSDKPVIETQITLPDRVNGNALTLIKLIDGTRCIVASRGGLNGGVGIDCDWSDTRLSEQQPRDLGNPDQELSIDQLLRERQK